MSARTLADLAPAPDPEAVRRLLAVLHAGSEDVAA